jgi:hypothetical protein
MRKVLPLVLGAAVATSGCSLFGGRSAGPDEFAVARNAPLVIPPDFSLTPPVAGTAGLTPEGAQSQAVDALFGGPTPRSASETSLLESAGRDSAQIGIRSVVGDPDTRLVDKGPVTRTILVAGQSNSQVASAGAPQ